MPSVHIVAQERNKGHRREGDRLLMPRRTGLRFEQLCVLWGLPAPVAEWRFDRPGLRGETKQRRWKFDYAWPGVCGGGVALEVQGGLFLPGGGRHSRGAALREEHAKLNEAAAQAWRIVFCTPEKLDSAPTLDLLRRCLG